MLNGYKFLYLSEIYQTEFRIELLPPNAVNLISHDNIEDFSNPRAIENQYADYVLNNNITELFIEEIIEYVSRDAFSYLYCTSIVNLLNGKFSINGNLYFKIFEIASSHFEALETHGVKKRKLLFNSFLSSLTKTKREILLLSFLVLNFCEVNDKRFVGFIMEK